MKRLNRLFKKAAQKEKSKKSGRKILPFPASTKPLETFPEVGIKLTVSGKDTLLNEVEGYLKKSLKSLEGVVLIDSNAEYWIDVICVVDSLNGYNLSYLIAGNFPRFNDELFEDIDEPAMEMMSDFLDGLCCVFEHRIKLGPSGSLNIACEEIVRDFDENYLGLFRNMWEAVSKGSL
jgi:hypothetical protein